MNIGIIGSGAIGGTLALKLSAAGHRITLANSRGADTIPERYLAPASRQVTPAPSRRTSTFSSFRYRPRPSPSLSM